MSWVCSNCSSSNGDDKTVCYVCGIERSSVPSVEVGETKGTIVFSDYEVWKKEKRDSINKIKAFIISLKERKGEPKERTPKPPKEKRKKVKSSEDATEERNILDESTERTPKPPKEKKKKRLIGSGSFAKPWSEHKIKFDIDAIKEKGYVRSEQVNMNGVNGYMFFKEDDSSHFIRVEMLLIQKMAHKI